MGSPFRGKRVDVNAAARAAQAMQLRVLGYSYAQIAERCGYSDKATAYNAVKRELGRTMQQPADDLRVLEAERLDAMLRTFLPMALKGDALAASRVLGIMDRRARLLGLDVKDESAAFSVPVVREYPAGATEAV